MQMVLSFGVEHHNSFLLLLLALQPFVQFGFISQVNHNGFNSYFYNLKQALIMWLVFVG
jgi:hypothetical protein